MNSALDQIRQWDGEKIIFGAGAAGRAAAQILQAAGITLSGFVDNNIAKDGVVIEGLTVRFAGDLSSHGLRAPLYIITVLDIADIVAQLDIQGKTDWIAGGNILDTFTTNDDAIAYAVDSCIACHQYYEHPEKIMIRSVDLVITEKCSLKCKDCSNLMQYYESPENYSVDGILETARNFLASVDYLNEFRVIGGEPFMHKQIGQILSYVLDQPKLNRVVIYTNGTIVPNEATLKVMANKKIILMITSYGPLSRNLEKFEATLRSHDIAFLTLPAQNWTACSEIKHFGRNEEENRDVFRQCCAKNLLTLMDGKFYRCPYAAHIDKLKAVPDFPDDYVVMQNVDKANLHDFLYKKKSLDACHYCAGRFLEDEKITPGLQVSAPLTYVKVR